MTVKKYSNYFLLPDEYSEEAINVFNNAFSFFEEANAKNVRLSQQVNLHLKNIPGNKGVQLNYKYDMINKKATYLVKGIIMNGNVYESRFSTEKTKYIRDCYDFGDMSKEYSSYNREKMIEDIRIHLYRSDILDYILS